MNICFVTAMYFSKPSTRMGGRGWGLHHWKAPFRNILSLGCPIVIYTTKHERDAIAEFIDSQKFSDYKIITHDLNDFQYSNNIYQLKTDKGMINDHGPVKDRFIENQRNHHLCLQKVKFLCDQSRINPFNKSKHFWIDFGLFHHGLFPDSLGGMEKLRRVDEENFWPVNQKSMFNPSIARGLDKVCNDDRVLMIRHNHHPVNADVSAILHVSQNNGYIIGGLFGGSSGAVEFLNNKFYEHVDILFKNNSLQLEEQNITAINGKYPESCNIVDFDHWYHDCPDPSVDRCCYGVSGKMKNFYKIFTQDLSD